MGVLGVIPKKYTAARRSFIETPGINAAKALGETKVDVGHLIGTQFGGASTLGNLATMERMFNQNTLWKSTERRIKSRIDNSQCGACVFIMPSYRSRKPVAWRFAVAMTTPGDALPFEVWGVHAPTIWGDLRAEAPPNSRYSSGKRESLNY
jgi:hypothetical protein